MKRLVTLFLFMALVIGTQVFAQTNVTAFADVSAETFINTDETSTTDSTHYGSMLLSTSTKAVDYSKESKGQRIIVFSKSKMVVALWNDGKLEKTYFATSGRASGDKEVQGDLKTPIGTFYVASKPPTKYTRAILVSYPAIEDAERGLADGLITEEEYESIVTANKQKETPLQYTNLGGLIEFHASNRTENDSHGCICLFKEDIIDLHSRVEVGDRIDILP